MSYFLTYPRRLADSPKQSEDAITNELPGNVPFAVKRDLMIRAMKSWKDLTDTCLTNVSSLLKDHVLELVDEHFGYYQVGQFGSSVKAVVIELLDKLLPDTANLLSILRELDASVFTINEHYLSSYTNKFAAHFAHQRQEHKFNRACSDVDRPQSLPRLSQCSYLMEYPSRTVSWSKPSLGSGRLITPMNSSQSWPSWLKSEPTSKSPSSELSTTSPEQSKID